MISSIFATEYHDAVQVASIPQNKKKNLAIFLLPIPI